jgi:predicted nuclease of predicted toxin-antitoxin system
LKLLLDENLSPILPAALLDCYGECQHVRDVGLKASSDAEVWEYAASKGLVIVTKDSDFRQRSFLHGHPPKVIWIGLGNCSTKMIEDLLRRWITEVAEFLADGVKAFLVLY